MAHLAINSLTIRGFKSIVEKRKIEIYPLTVLAGANSSGKSSALQPFLILKQTLEAPHDPGPLMINGPNVKFTAHRQFVPMSRAGSRIHQLEVGISIADSRELSVVYEIHPRGELEISEMRIVQPGFRTVLRPGMPENELLEQVPHSHRVMFDQLSKALERKGEWQVVRDRCFLGTRIKSHQGFTYPGSFPFLEEIWALRGLIHVRGLRGNPERNYSVSAVGSTYSGPFEDYVASILQDWQDKKDPRMVSLCEALEALGLTTKVTTRKIEDVQVELRVGRLPHKTRGKTQTVSMADVGFGVSQVLPVLVALLVAGEGQTVYVEQPEIHLHPFAQMKLADIMLSAAKRGIRVIVETHSALLLLAIQAAAAEQSGDHRLVKLHWFQRDPKGETQVTSADLDESGAFGEWPMDFIDVSLDLQDRFLSAASRHTSPS